nr:uncharacterized protein LOC113740852 [Coffea arabica]
MEQGQDRVNLTINIFWQIWKARNKRIFDSAKQEPHKTVQKAQEEWLEFEQAREIEQESRTGQNNRGHQARREQLREDVVSLYTDAAISAKRIRTGQGIIARNWKGTIMRAKGIVNQWKGTASKEEALAVRNALLMAKQAGWTKIIVHTDCKSVVEQINRCSEYDYSIATIQEDVQDLRIGFDKCSFVFIPRTENEISHALAHFAVKVVHNIEWEQDFPIWLIDLVKREMRRWDPTSQNSNADLAV